MYTFENWFMRILPPHIKRKPGLKVCICDNLSSHLNQQVLAKCRKYEIKFVFIPVNTTHLTQPLDVAFFSPMKRKWRTLLCDWKSSARGQQNLTLPKSDFLRLLINLWNEILPNSSRNLQKGFETCGISPTTVDPLLKRLPRRDHLNVDKVGDGFMKFVEARRGEIMDCVPQKRKATNIVAGL